MGVGGAGNPRDRDGLPAVEVIHLSRRFGRIEAVRDVSFTVAQGEIFGLLGPNGAGKTTTIKVLLSLLRPSGGTARVLGVDVAQEPHRVRQLIGWVPQETAVDPLLTGRENLLLVAGLYHLPPGEAARRVDELLALVELAGAADRVVREYSGGMRKRLDLAMGLVHRPAVLFLDEPTLGLDIQTRRRLWQYIRAFRELGTTILLTTHYLEEADQLCDRVAIIDRGRIRALGTPDELKARYAAESLQLRLAPGQDRRAVAALAAQLAALSEVHEVRWGGPAGPGATAWAGGEGGPGELAGVLWLRVTHHVAALPSVLAACRRTGVAVAAVEPRRATLDDVFLRITGHALREDGAAAGPLGEEDPAAGALHEAGTNAGRPGRAVRPPRGKRGEG
ncbi:ATP-binding cassette domain-containing protein [Thermaerobacter marianensis]|uniref:ABC transporter ATP-binding protein n=1 Tax=Thermaerobacter marianensis TaxID=73919 RepID=UPI0011D1A1A0